MKKQLLIALTLLTAGTINVTAQLKVNSNGNVYVKEPVEELSFFAVGNTPAALISQGAYDDYSMGIHADKYNSSNTNCVAIYGESRQTNYSAKHSIGVLGRACHLSMGRSFGVCGLSSGSKGAGVYGSTGNIPSSDFTGIYAGYFNGNTYVNGIFTANSIINLSDMRLRYNVTSLTESDRSDSHTLNSLLSLNICSYNLHNPAPKEDLDLQGDNNIKEENEEEDNRLHYGISAQELQKIYPDLVTEGQDGYLSVNYIELVPILIRSIQELKQELDDVKCLDAAQARSDATTIRTATAANGNVLYQNTPNPFKEKTTIRFSLADNSHDAAICIFDMSGKLIKKLPVSRGDTSVSVNGYELGEGMFLYTLMVSGQEVDTKRMIITK